jgi:putative chitinase
MAHNPVLIANQAYGSRMGNHGTNTMDGWNYRGRGFCQTTGREAYTNLATLTGLDLVNHPELVNDPQYVMQIATKDFAQCGCIPYAQRDDVVNVTKKLNGGLIGLAQREQWLGRWKSALGVDATS